MGRHLSRRMIEGTGGKVLELLRQGPRTVDELASELGLTRTAVRAHLATLERDGLVEQRGSRRGTSKPSRLYGVSAQAELLFSQAYIPILTRLLHVLARRLSPDEFESTMRDVGRELMQGHRVVRGALSDRVAGASALLNELGGLSEVEEENGSYLIRSHGCPLAAATANHPEVCNVLENMLTEFVGSQVTKCCDRHDRAGCCFEIPKASGGQVEMRH